MTGTENAAVNQMGKQSHCSHRAHILKDKVGVELSSASQNVGRDVAAQAYQNHEAMANLISTFKESMELQLRLQ